MIFLKADTNTEVLIGPAVAVGDGFTPVTTLSLSTADEAELIKYGGATALTVTSISANAMSAITSADGYYTLDLSTSNTDTEGFLVVVINDDSLILPIRQEFMVVNANVYDSLFAAAATDVLDVNVTQWLGTAAATPTVAGVPEVDLTHVAGATTNVSALATNVDAILTDTGTTLDTKLNTAQADLDVLTGTDGATLATAQANYAPAKAGDSMALTAAAVDAVWDEVITSGAHNTADSSAKYLRQLRTNGVYLNGAVFVDTLNGTAGTEDYENGTDHNPVDLIASANTIATSIGLTKFHIANGSSITFAASQAGDAFVGEAWTLALGTQSIVGCYIQGATVSGVGNGVGTTQIFEHCIVGATTVPKGTIFRECAFTGTLTFGEAGDIRLVHCVSGIAGAASPTIDMGAAVGASTLELRGWSGGITLNNLATGDVVTLDGTFGTITLNGADATVEIRGSYKVLTNNLTGSPSVNDAAANLQTIDANVDAILADTNELQSDDIPTTLATLATTAELNKVPKSDGTTSWNATALAAINAEADTALTDYDPPTRAELTTDINTVVTDLDDIKGTGFIKDTHSLVDIETFVDILDDGTSGNAKIATDVAAVLVDTGTTIPGTITTLQADTDDIQTRLPAALVSGKMDSDMTAISGDTVAADNLEGMMDGVIVAQVNDASATTTAFAADGFTETTDDHFNGRLITFISGNLSGQQTDITDYDAAGHTQGSQAFVVSALTEAPANNDFFVIH